MSLIFVEREVFPYSEIKRVIEKAGDRSVLWIDENGAPDFLVLPDFVVKEMGGERFFYGYKYGGKHWCFYVWYKDNGKRYRVARKNIPRDVLIYKNKEGRFYEFTDYKNSRIHSGKNTGVHST